MRLYLTRMLYSPKSHESAECGRPTPGRNPLADQRAGTLPIARWGALRTAISASGTRLTSGWCGTSRSAALRPIFDVKEAHSIGMTRGHSTSFPTRSSIRPSTLLPRLCASLYASLNSELNPNLNSGSLVPKSPSGRTRSAVGLLAVLVGLTAGLALSPSAHAQSASAWNKREIGRAHV